MAIIPSIVGWLACSFWFSLLSVVVLGIVAVAGGVAFGLTLTGAIGLYFVVRRTVLFAILPVRLRSQAEAGAIVEGTDPGAPATPALYERAVWTSVAAALVFLVVAAFFPLAGL